MWAAQARSSSRSIMTAILLQGIPLFLAASALSAQAEQEECLGHARESVLLQQRQEMRLSSQSGELDEAVAERHTRVPCVDYNTSHPLVQKQLQGGTLTREEVTALVQAPVGKRLWECLPAPDTDLIHGDDHKCIERKKLYTVCYDLSYRHDYHGPAGSVHCGVFIGGVPALRANGKKDCMGGCNEGSRACRVREHRSSCFAHDVCSVVQDAKGFTSDRHCGNEADRAVRTTGRCAGKRW